MSDDLVKRLRDPSVFVVSKKEAADRIEELEAERDKAWKTCLAATTRGMELEAKLINAGSALEMCMDMLEALQEESGRSIEYGEEDAFRMGEWFEAYEFKCLALARATLAELKGEQP